MTDATIGYGARMYVESATSPGESPPSYVELAEITTMTMPNFEVDDVDVTHMQSPNRTREFIAGLINPGEAGFEMNWVPGSASDIILLNLKTAGTNVSWKALISDVTGYYWSFDGYIKGFEPTMETEDKKTVTVTIKVNGDPTISYLT